MKGVKHIFFDLDKTLWDFRGNSFDSLQELYYEFKLEQEGIRDFLKFFDCYVRINEQFWSDYRDNKVGKDEVRWKRFYSAFEHFGIQNHSLARNFATVYLERTPRRSKLMDGALETLHYLSGKYSLHVITNGFRETQLVKLQSGNLLRYFKSVVNSDDAGFRKPEREIFLYAHRLSGSVDNNECLMIGDDLKADVEGAREFGWNALWYNPEKLKGPEHIQCINALSELTIIF